MSAVRTKVTRASKQKQVMDQYAKQIRQIVGLGGNMVRNTAVQSIHKHSSGGVTYNRGGRSHTASAAGQPPNTDTGYLASNIHLVLDADKMGCSVESRADYSEALEYGTSNMAARPFMQPALEENRKKIMNLFERLDAKVR